MTSYCFRAHCLSTKTIGLLVLFITLYGNYALAATLETKQKALEVITKTATDLCNSVSDKTLTSRIELSGDAKAKLNGLIGKVVDLGIEGAGRYISEESQGVLQEDLAKLLSHNADCKFKVFESLRDLLLGTTEDNQTYPIVLKEGRYPVYNIRDFGRVDGANSSINVEIDNSLVFQHILNKPFGSHTIQLAKGDHTFNFTAAIRRKGDDYATTINANCEGTFNINRARAFEPRLKFESYGKNGGGGITSCSLVESP